MSRLTDILDGKCLRAGCMTKHRVNAKEATTSIQTDIEEAIGEDGKGVELTGLLGASEEEKDHAIQINKETVIENKLRAEIRAKLKEGGYLK